jgi:hypothetical protein
MKLATKDDIRLHREMNIGVLSLLKKNNSNLNNPHYIINVFYAFDEQGKIMLHNLLVKHGYTICEIKEAISSDDSSYSIVEASMKAIPDIKQLNEMTDACVAMAIESNSDYDGWYTQPVE